MDEKTRANWSEHFEREGYLVVPNALDADTLERLRVEYEVAARHEAEALDRAAESASPLSRRGERYYIAGRSRRRPALHELVTSELMRQLCAALIGPNAYGFNELFVSKLPHPQSGFVWHQDYAYLAALERDFPPNLTVWMALDATTEVNGAIRVIPWSRGGARELIPHALERDWTRETVADFGGVEDSVLLEVDAGSIICMSGLLPHASGPNLSDEVRRAYLVQYSPQVVEVEGEALQLATPVLVNGEAPAA